MLLATYADSMTPAPESPVPLEVRVSTDASVQRSETGALTVFSATTSNDAPLMFSLEGPLGDAEGFWHPNARSFRTLPADWAGRQSLSLVSSTPLGVLYDKAGSAVLGFACDETVDEITMRFGVCEERNTLVVHLELAPRAGGRTARLAVSTGAAIWTGLVAELKQWLVADLELELLPVPDAAVEPVYSTWYTFSQQVSAALVEEEAAIARSLGCASVFIDDGWQQHGEGRGYAGCGDWLPDREKFPDLAQHVQRLHDLDLAVVLWLAPLMVGRLATDFDRLAPLAPHFSERLDTALLDPRRPEVRDHVVGTCLRLMQDYSLDGLKIDFLDQAMVYQGTPSSGDVEDVGAAMLLLLRQLRDALRDAGWEAPLLEFRQPYVSPSLAPFGNILRAGDCPADSAMNRISTIDCRLLSFGQVVHADMMMWDPLADAETGARQLLNTFFAVPQISMRLAELPEHQLRALSFVLRQWRAVRDVALFGELTPGLPDEWYPVVQSWDGAGNGVVGIYAAQHVPVDLAGRRTVTVLNATRLDHVVLDLAGPVTGAQVSTVAADGSRPETVLRSLGEGLVKLPVPPCGFAIIAITDE